MNLYEAGALAFGVASVWLAVRENVWCWPTGLVNVVLLFVVFLQARFYAAMGLQVVYFALSVYGWHQWLHGGEQRGTLRVSRAPLGVLVLLAVLSLVATAGLGRALARWTDAALPYWDAGTSAFSVAAQFLVSRKWIENWVIWIAVDVVCVGLYLYQRIPLTASLYAVFLVLAVLGLREWKRSLQASVPA